MIYRLGRDVASASIGRRGAGVRSVVPTNENHFYAKKIIIYLLYDGRKSQNIIIKIVCVNLFI